MLQEKTLILALVAGNVRRLLVKCVRLLYWQSTSSNGTVSQLVFAIRIFRRRIPLAACDVMSVISGHVPVVHVCHVMKLLLCPFNCATVSVVRIGG